MRAAADAAICGIWDHLRQGGQAPGLQVGLPVPVPPARAPVRPVAARPAGGATVELPMWTRSFEKAVMTGNVENTASFLELSAMQRRWCAFGSCHAWPGVLTVYCRNWTQPEIFYHRFTTLYVRYVRPVRTENGDTRF